MPAFPRVAGEWTESIMSARDADAWSDLGALGWVWDGGAWVLFQSPGVQAGQMNPPENLSISGLTDNDATLNWTDPAQTIIPTETQVRIVTTTAVWDIATYGVTAYGWGALLPETDHIAQVRYVQRTNGQVTATSPVASIAFSTLTPLLGQPAPDPGGTVGETTFPFADTVPGTPTAPSTAFGCWWEWEWQILSQTQWAWLDTGITGTKAGSISSFDYDMALLDPTRIYRLKWRSACDTTGNGTADSFGDWQFGDGTPGLGDWGANCAGIPDSSNIPGAFRLLGSLIGGVTELLSPSDVWLEGSTIFVADTNTNAITSIDASDPSLPVLDSTEADNTNLDSCYSIFVVGNYAYLTAFGPGAANDRLTIVDVTDPSSMTVEGVEDDALFDSLLDAAPFGTDYVVAIAGTDQTLSVIDITTKTAPVVVGQLTDARYTNHRSVVVVGNYAYSCGGGSDNLVITNLTVPGTPAIDGELLDATNLDFPSSVAVSGNYAYVATQNAGLAVVDVTTKTAPSHETNLNDARIVYPRIIVHNDHVFGASGNTDTIVAVDVSTPTAPTFVNEYATGLINPRRCHAVGTTLVVADEDSNAVRIFSISEFS